MTIKSERARRSGALADQEKARRLAKGLLACASVSDVPGFIARGMGTDGKCHYPMSSQDQTHPWFYGLHAYATSGIADAEEQKLVVDKMKEVAEALEGADWKCPCDGAFKGQFRGDFKKFRHHGVAMYLFILRAMHDVTGDDVWLKRYCTALAERSPKTGKSRLQICEEGYPHDHDQIKHIDRALLWIYVSSQGGLAELARMETDEAIRAQYRAGLAVNARGALAVIDKYKTFDNRDTKVFGHARWREGYPDWFPQKTQADAEKMAATRDLKVLGKRKWYEADRMRNPLCAKDVTNLFLAGRHISTSHVAFGSARVMRTLGVLGEVVGMTATICAKENIYPRDVYKSRFDKLIDMMMKGVPHARTYHTGGGGHKYEGYHFKDTGHLGVYPHRSKKLDDPSVKKRIKALDVQHMK